MIDAIGVRKRFGALEVLRGIDLSVRPGRVTAIVGPNGAGKTTFIKAILGLTRIDAGRLTFDGQPINGDCAYRARIGYMPQIARFPENLTGRELLAMICDLRGPCPDIDTELTDAFGLQAELDKPLRTLSGGTRQKLNAVLAFLFHPDLLVLDEPTAGLDPVASGVLKDRILADRAEGRTCIVTSHVLSELEELADDVVFLFDGRVGFSGAMPDLKALTRQSTLERAIAEIMRRNMMAVA
jgi:Cu-processing system ATP-binding protein